jgi:hypothetical protein
LEGLRLENVDIFYGHLEYFADIWDILWSFVPFYVHLVHFGIMYQEKSGNPGQGDQIRRIFAKLVIAFFGAVPCKLLKYPINLSHYSMDKCKHDFRQKWVGLQFGWFFTIFLIVFWLLLYIVFNCWIWHFFYIPKLPWWNVALVMYIHNRIHFKYVFTCAEGMTKRML